MKTKLLGAALLIAGINAQAANFVCTVNGESKPNEYGKTLATKFVDMKSKESQVIYTEGSVMYIAQASEDGGLSLAVADLSTGKSRVAFGKTDKYIVLLDNETKRSFGCFNPEQKQ
jgi:hypothetical protein